ncbi:MAG: endopeptidase La [Desulfocapsa sp.]|nr:endopeptidase La [Desulfocapsa sp.]
MAGKKTTHAEAEMVSEGGERNDIAIPHLILPKYLYLIPIASRPFFPGQVQPIVLSGDYWQETIQKIGETEQKMVGLIYTGNIPAQKTVPEDFAQIGCVGKILKPNMQDSNIHFICQGLQRFRIRRWMSREVPFLAEVEYPAEDDKKISMDDTETRAYAMSIISAVKELVQANPLQGEELKQALQYFSPSDPAPLTDFAATLTTATGEDLQLVLETLPILARMQRVFPLLKKEVEITKLHSEIRRGVNEKIGKRQRQFFLHEQLKTIQKELGITKDDRKSDEEEFAKRLDRLNPPQPVADRIDEEMKKLSFLEKGSQEYAVTRNYLDWMSSVPWGVFSEDKLGIKEARYILDRDHDGLADVKERIIEFLAVGAYKKEIAGSIMLLVGPPGVGKTSIGRSVAEAMGRKFYRFSLGGMRDEAEIKGHRRTYIGSMPGKFVQALKEAKTANPVIMLDEIDKIGASFRGDPASALLEVLDPEQNADFLDHYLDLRVDLSKVLFICTANQLDTIPGPLLDRMEVIRLSGYITEEKMDIARNHLWPKALKQAGLKKGQLKISDAALKLLIEGYAREAGVRKTEKELLKIVRKSVVKFLEDPTLTISITMKNLEEYLGKPFFKKKSLISGVGVVTGLAWTALGGVTLAVEAAAVPSKNSGFKQTGQLGDVMRESSEIAYSFLLSNAKRYGVKEDFFESHFIHLHVPEGATPKDGPSAGITMASALLSLGLGLRMKRSLAMTGELTLTGKVLPVGGIKEKVIAAKRNGIKELILPEANRGDFESLPYHIKEGFQAHFIGKYDQVAKVVVSALKGENSD